MSRRIVVEEVCPIHKKAKPHFLWGIKGIPRCPSGSRTILFAPSEALRVLFPDGPTDEMVKAVAAVPCKEFDGQNYSDSAIGHALSPSEIRDALDAAFGLADRKDE